METKHPNPSVLAVVWADFKLHFVGHNGFVAQGASFTGPFAAPQATGHMGRQVPARDALTGKPWKVRFIKRSRRHANSLCIQAPFQTTYPHFELVQGWACASRPYRRLFGAANVPGLGADPAPRAWRFPKRSAVGKGGCGRERGGTDDWATVQTAYAARATQAGAREETLGFRVQRLLG